ncbi:MAG: hypothetical protein HOD60_14490 [Candidatus Nitrosopelagicus sp.]|jgi:hypothetical protein|nr:hypothetical protein [Candidatus Nitrosopelagicus sp.]
MSCFELFDITRACKTADTKQLGISSKTYLKNSLIYATMAITTQCVLEISFENLE